MLWPRSLLLIGILAVVQVVSTVILYQITAAIVEIPEGTRPLLWQSLLRNWMPMLLGFVPTLAAWILADKWIGVTRDWSRRKFQRDLMCSVCEYPVVMNGVDSWKCPECGTAFDAGGKVMEDR